ncbi:hypothetical protein NHF39_25510 [Pseudomonas proteolytica]|nr:hypothetical protein NHF39_25510 [Pseudomonas proteolytica]
MGKGIVQILAQSNQISTVFWKGRSLDSVNDSLVELENQWSRQVKKRPTRRLTRAPIPRKDSNC